MSRYPPPPDSRFNPRERSRSPPRFGDRRPSIGFNPAFTGRNPPAGPRGRGAPPNAEFNELRNAPPLGSARDRPFRDREFDRRIRAPSPPRPRSPLRPYRDGPQPPRDPDINRPRRDSRDGPFSAGPNFAEPPPFANSPFGRGGFGGRGRGRGRGDFDFRDRGRRPPFEDRSGFRPRERSPPPPRWNRDPSRGRGEDWRPERHDEDRWSERDEREREYDRFRREQPATRFDHRNSSDTNSRPPTPHQPIAAVQAPPQERPMPEQPREDIPTRRSSATVFPPGANQQRRDPTPQTDLMAGRAEATNSRYSARSSPPLQAPQVPAFGGLSFKPPPASGPPHNVWRAPPSPAQPARAPSPDIKSAPTGPKAQTTAAPAPMPAPPAAPRALRGLESNAPMAGFREPPPIFKPNSQPQPPIPTAPAALRHEERQPPVPVPQQRDVRAFSGPFSASASGAPNASWASAQSSLPGRAASVEPSSTRPLFGDRKASMPSGSRPEIKAISAVTPPPMAPSGPRHSQSLNASPSQGIPTAPKADRLPPTAPRAVAGRGQAPLGRPMDRPPPTAPRAPFGVGPPRGPNWNQWTRDGVPSYRDAVIPAKRDSNGEEKSQQYKTDPSPKPSMTSTSSNAPEPPSENKQANVHMHSLEQETHVAREDIAEAKGEIDDVGDPVEPMSTDESSEDDGMDLDEEDFESTKAKFEQQKARLQAQLLDLSDRQYRATTPLEQIARLAKVTAQDLPSEDEMTPEGDAPSLEDEAPSRSGSQHLEEDGEQDLLTPKEEDAEDVVMAGNDILDQIMPRPPKRKQSPEIINLPYLLKSPLTPFSGSDTFQESLARQGSTKAAVIAHLQAQADQADEAEQYAFDDYADIYRGFSQRAQTYDDERLSREKEEYEKSADPGPEFDMAATLMELPNTESSRRLHKFSSEYDIQKVLKESEETARIEQEKLEREAKKAKDDLEKEAPLPPTMTEEMRQRRAFVNHNTFRSAWRLTDIFGYDPPTDDFTADEHKRFLETFKERPKKWGEIAAVLPGRTYQHCIHHYYAFKWDGRFRETKGKRRAKIGRGRGGKGPRVRGAALMADLSRTEDDLAPNALGVSESGRPKRAAARATYTDKDSEGKSTSVTATPGKKGTAKLDANGEPSEKPIKRRKNAAGEKLPKKGRAMPLAAAPSGSPLKMERDVQFRASELSREDQARVEEASLLAGLQSSYNRVQADVVPMYSTEAFLQSTAPVEHVDRVRPTGQGPLQRSSASSYWSVPEVQDFMKFIGHFGTDFGAIAAHMGTKTQTMVKNYYQRHAESGNRQDLIDAANAANARRERGEDMGVPPAPTPIVKRRYDNPQPAAPRVLAPHAEPIEVEDAPTLVPPTAASSQTRFPVTTQSPAVPQRAAQTPLQAAIEAATSKPSSLARPQPPGPRMGFFSEPRMEQRPSVQPFAPSRPGPQPQSQPTQAKQQQNQIQARLQQEAQDPNSQWRRELIKEQERAMSLVREQERLSQERVPQLPPQHPLYAPLAPHPIQSTPTHMPAERKPLLEEQRSRTPSVSSVSAGRPGQSILRNILGSPSLATSAPPPLHPTMQPGPIPSPPKTVGFRPSSVPAAPASQLPVKAAPVEPRKTSNLASLLNSEPEEPRPSKRMSDQSVHSVVNRTQSPAPLVRNPTPVGQSSGLPMGRRETFGQASAPRSMFERPATAQPLPPSHAPTPPPKTEHPFHWANLQSARSREDWTPRTSIAQAPPSSSPRETPLEREVRPYYSHRSSAFGHMNVPPHGNPSPPPHAHPLAPHSRTSSFSHSASAPPQQQQQPGQPQGSHILQPNPYTQPPGPAAHVQQMQSQQQNQMHHSQNAPMGPGMHTRQLSREEEFAHQQNERYYREKFEMDNRAREREAQYQAQQHEQQRFGQHRPPPQPMHPSMHQEPQPGFVSLREQAGLEASQRYREAQMRYDRERQEQDRKERPQWKRDEGEEEEGRRRFAEELRASGAFVPKSANNWQPPRRR